MALVKGLCRDCLREREEAKGAKYCERCGRRMKREAPGLKLCEACRREELDRILAQTKPIRERLAREQIEKAKGAILRALGGRAVARWRLLEEVNCRSRFDEALGELEREGRIERRGPLVRRLEALEVAGGG